MNKKVLKFSFIIMLLLLVTTLLFSCKSETKSPSKAEQDQNQNQNQNQDQNMEPESDSIDCFIHEKKNLNDNANPLFYEVITGFSPEARNKKSIIIPGKIEGVPVILGEGNPLNTGSIEKIILNEGAYEIEDGSFSHNSTIKEIIIPASVEIIDYEAFCGCSSIETIRIAKNSKLREINGNALLVSSTLTIYIDEELSVLLNNNTGIPENATIIYNE